MHSSKLNCLACLLHPVVFLNLREVIKYGRVVTLNSNTSLTADHVISFPHSACDIPHSPLFINCTKNNTVHSKVNPEEYTKMKGLRTRLSHLQDLNLSDVNMTWTDRGVYFAPKQHLKVIKLQPIHFYFWLLLRWFGHQALESKQSV